MTADPPAPPPRTGWQPKGYLGPFSLTVVLLLAALPLLMVAARLLAGPGAAAHDLAAFDGLRQLGGLLERSFTLQWVPPSDRGTIIYLVLLPGAALLVTIARLTFGLRVLGYRSILIAAGFQEIGLLPSLVLMAGVLAVILLLRLPMRRMRLPMYARISLIMGLTACMMVGALFVGPWLRSELVWSLAFFPVIILAMMAESIAGTLDHSTPVTAAWRLGWTLALALLLLPLMTAPAVQAVALRFPELMLTQLAAIVLVAEFLDLRLLQEWPAQWGQGPGRWARWLQGQGAAPAGVLRVALVRNRSPQGVIARRGAPPEVKDRTGSVQHLVDALRAEGCVVKVFEGDISLLRELQKFMPPHPRSGVPGGVVLNLSVGLQGRGRVAHVPAMLEMAGLPYTGPDPMALARLHDRHALLTTLQQAGVPVAAFQLLHQRPFSSLGMAMPLWVRPRYESEEPGVLVRTFEELAEAVSRLMARPDAPGVVVEAWAPGQEYRVTVLGGATLDCLPVLHQGAGEAARLCPADLDPAVADEMQGWARHAFRVTGCRDIARVDLRLGPDGRLQVLRVLVQEILARKGSVAVMAEAAGLGWGELLRRVVHGAAVRHGAAWPPPAAQGNVVPLLPASGAEGARQDTARAPESVAPASEPQRQQGEAP